MKNGGEMFCFLEVIYSKTIDYESLSLMLMLYDCNFLSVKEMCVYLDNDYDNGNVSTDLFRYL